MLTRKQFGKRGQVNANDNWCRPKRKKWQVRDAGTHVILFTGSKLQCEGFVNGYGFSYKEEVK